MEKRKAVKDETVLQHPFMLALVLVLGLVVMDPFHMGPLGDHEFVPVKHEIAPYHQVIKTWPRDNLSRLGLLGKSEFNNQVFGPESLEFDPMGRGPYAGLADGRIVRWMGKEVGWETFALVTSNWTEKICFRGNESTTAKQWKHEKTCGRPLGLRFEKESGNLYIADAYFGLLVVGPDGGVATPLATHVQGNPILFANDLDIHHNGSIFFTDTSTRYNRVLMKLWVQGPKTGSVEHVADLPGFPDNIRMNEKGEFWVAIDCCRTAAQEVLTHNPWIRNIYFRLPMRMSLLARLMGMKMYTVISLVDENGHILDVLEDREGKVMKLVSEVREQDGKLWIGTVAHNHIATLPYPPTLIT
ncbi:protein STRICTOSIDINE SYNTHASE-LIKE 13 [Senna tora]|uniref:Protein STRICTOSIDINE SYNTHASE-LIKE 13 n=1 Tax=Senna tora TaxID=362788 RepID=A0A834W5X5_9FABA|nr:protein STRICTOSIDINE SYNTHASE-LIKE 13 [Senna tora]